MTQNTVGTENVYRNVCESTFFSLNLDFMLKLLFLIGLLPSLFIHPLRIMQLTGYDCKTDVMRQK